MKHGRATEEIREWAALYALGSLSQHEAQSFENHLQEGCAVCEAEFHQFTRIVAAIGLAAEEVAAPEYVRELLSTRIERETQATPPAAAASNNLDAEPVQKEPSLSYPARPIFAQSDQPKSSFFPWILAVIIACLAFLALYAWKSEQGTNSRLRAAVSAAQAEGKDLERLLEIQRERGSELEQIVSIVGKSEARFMRLKGQAAAPSASGILLWDTQQSQCLTFGLFPPAPQGRAYQLWFITPQERIPAGLLKTDPFGRAFTTLAVPPDMTNWTAAAVTLEPDNGSQIPTMPFYALGRFE